jgi:acetyl-CoA hydrolase
LWYVSHRNFPHSTGASVGLETEDRWAKNDMISGRWPYITGKYIANNINNGKMDMGDAHVSNFAQYLKYGFFTMKRPLDIGIIEVAEIAPDGGLLLGGAVGCVPEIVDKAEKLIIEVYRNCRFVTD